MHNSDIQIPKVEFDSNGNLIIQPSITSSKDDFNFYQGKWQLLNKKLKNRLNNCNEWVEFASTQEMYKVLNGLGNIDNYLASFEGNSFEGMSVRLFKPQTRLWSIYWADSNEGVLQPPVQGSFDHDIAHFFAKDFFNDQPILVVFRWDIRDKENPIWSQAFSADKGETWEWNWFMYFSKAR